MGFHHRAPVVAQRAQLRALRFSALHRLAAGVCETDSLRISTKTSALILSRDTIKF